MKVYFKGMEVSCEIVHIQTRQLNYDLAAGSAVRQLFLILELV